MIPIASRFSSAFDEIDSRVLYVANKLQSIIFDPLINQENIDSAFIESIASKAALFKTEASDLLQEMSHMFWTENIENEITASLGFSAFLLRLIESLEDSSKLNLVGKCFRFKYKFIIERILLYVNKSQELLSFNISALILFANLEYRTLFSLEIKFWAYKNTVTFNLLTEKDYHRFFIKYIKETRFFYDFFLTIVTEDEFTLIVEKALTRTFIVSNELIEYGTDGFTTYDLKIYIRSFSSDEDLQKGSVFYVFLHELCHFLRRAKCTSKAESQRVKTPEQSVKGTDLFVGDFGYVFEFEMFGSPQRSLNIEACRYLCKAHECSLEEFRREFCEINSKTGLAFVELCRKSLGYKENVVELLGCGFNRRR